MMPYWNSPCYVQPSHSMEQCCQFSSDYECVESDSRMTLDYSFTWPSMVDCCRTEWNPSPMNTYSIHLPTEANWTNQLTTEPPAKHYRSFEYKATECKQFFGGDVYANCRVSHVDGESVTLRMDELIDMVLTAARNVDDADGSASPSDREKRRVREKNKHAAQLYRKRRNERLSNMKKECLRLEAVNVNLKNNVKALEDEVAAYKASIARYLHIL